jgi:hypothetical protein
MFFFQTFECILDSGHLLVYSSLTDKHNESDIDKVKRMMEKNRIHILNAFIFL